MTDQILLVKRRFGIEVWSIDITRLPIKKILEFILNERGDNDCQVKRVLSPEDNQ